MTRAEPPICTDAGSVPAGTLAAQIWALCALKGSGRTGPKEFRWVLIAAIVNAAAGPRPSSSLSRHPVMDPRADALVALVGRCGVDYVAALAREPCLRST
jgi:hypothetical protein